MEAYQKVKDYFSEIHKLNHAIAMLSWDEAVMMPEKSGLARAESVSCLRKMVHEKLTDKSLLPLIEEAKLEQDNYDGWQLKNLLLIERKAIEANGFEANFVEEFSQATMHCEQAWRELRGLNDWQSFKPLLEKVVDLVRERAKILGELKSLSDYDALLDDFSPGVTQSSIDPIFSQLQEKLPTIVEQAIDNQATPIPFKGTFEIAKQEKLAKSLMNHLGFDFARGRVDTSHHPFCGGVQEDVRITTRYNESEFLSAVMGICHETGHALYEFGLPKDYRGQPVGEAYGMTFHESQSLLMEMQVCRSRAFMPILRQQLLTVFSDQPAFSAENLYHHQTHISKGLIRVDADELTYPLHIILRYSLEKELISGQCEVGQLPELWDHYMQSLLSLSTMGNDKDGVMQDVHWPSGAFGYFPAYTLGAIMAAQIAAKMQDELQLSDIKLEIEDFSKIVKWLGEHVYHYGSRYELNELMKKVTKKPLGAEDFLVHLKSRYIS